MTTSTLCSTQVQSNSKQGLGQSYSRNQKSPISSLYIQHRSISSIRSPPYLPKGWRVGPRYPMQQDSLPTTLTLLPSLTMSPGVYETPFILPLQKSPPSVLPGTELPSSKPFRMKQKAPWQVSFTSFLHTPKSYGQHVWQSE